MGAGGSSVAASRGCWTKEETSAQHAAVGYPVLWINLDRCAERREAMEASLATRGIVAMRVAAVDCAIHDPATAVHCVPVPAPDATGSEPGYRYPRIVLPVEEDAAGSEETGAEETEKKTYVTDGSADLAYLKKRHDRGPATRTELACTLSHFIAQAKAVQVADATGADAVLIIEDDVTLGIDRVHRWPVSLPAIVRELPVEWEYLQLYTPNPRVVRGPNGLLSKQPRLASSSREGGGGSDAPTRPEKKKKQRPLAIRRTSSKVFGTQAYLLSKRGLDRIRAQRTRPADGATPRLEHWADVRLVADHWVPSLFPEAHSYVATVPTFVEDGSVSTIAPGQNEWSHDTARETYLRAFDEPADHWQLPISSSPRHLDGGAIVAGDSKQHPPPPANKTGGEDPKKQQQPQPPPPVHLRVEPPAASTHDADTKARPPPPSVHRVTPPSVVGSKGRPGAPRASRTGADPPSSEPTAPSPDQLLEDAHGRRS